MWIRGGIPVACPQAVALGLPEPEPVGSPTVRQLYPTPIDSVDPLALYPADERPAPPDRPWVVLGMISSIDGATAVDGLSGGLGGPADQAVFAAVRASCDWILVASTTAATEGYRAPNPRAAVAARRVETGRTPAPGLAIVTASGAVDPAIPALADRPADTAPPLVLTGTEADAALLDGLDAEVVRLDGPIPEPHLVLAELRRRGADVVLSEGGPRGNGRLVGAGVVDEVCLTVGPILAGGHSTRIIHDAPEGAARTMRLDRLLEQDGLLFARYIRDVSLRVPGE